MFTGDTNAIQMERYLSTQTPSPIPTFEERVEEDRAQRRYFVNAKIRRRLERVA